MRFSLLVLFFLLILFFTPINIMIEYLRNGQDDNFTLQVYILLKIFGFKVKVPYLQNKFIVLFSKIFAEIDSIFMKIWPWKNKVTIEKEIGLKDLQLKKLKKIIKVSQDKEVISIILCGLKIKCLKLEWETEFGWVNPALTAITSGFIWMIKGILLRIIDEYSLFQQNPRVKVCPDFNNKRFRTSFQGIFSLLIGNIILTMIKVILYKFKGGFRPWANIQLKN